MMDLLFLLASLFLRSFRVYNGRFGGLLVDRSWYGDGGEVMRTQRV